MVLTSAYAAFVTSDNLSPDDALNEVYTRYIIIGGSYMLSMAYKINNEQEVQPHLEYKTADPKWSPWYKGYKLTWNIRGVGTSWENPYLWPGVKYTWNAPKSTANLRKPGAIHGSRHNLMARGRLGGILIRFFYAVINFFLLACLYEFGHPQYLLDAGPMDFAPEKESIIRRGVHVYFGRQMITPVTLRDVSVRAVAAIENAAGNFLTFSLYHDVCAIFFIAVGLDESWEWPPFFGNITEAYTMRRWYVNTEVQLKVIF
ncbi:hypothetical protein SLS60_008412 [Paraconiothyrium brasiliense]|uniref:DUF5683 domain-containing protein n=1 Tax=Paraconiothyrium brasiliense TaxID=300254 RepID=A0ABR3R0I1_9PLEO